jgi:putative inorganic carbon (hco3(-)) transporter
MRDLAILLVFVMYLCVGMPVPFVAALGYVWVDTFYPQAVSYGLLSYVPVSLIVALVAMISYMLFDRRAAPRPGFHLLAAIAMFLWVTASLEWALVPDAAWSKWNWAGKTVAFSALIPFFFRSRLQIEAFVLTWTFSAIIHIMPVGIKTIATGGGYGQELGVVSGNSLLSEGSTLATVCAAFVPLLLWGRRHSTLVPERLRTPGFVGYAALAGAAAIGTFARTTLLAFGVMALGTLFRSQRKVLGLGLLGVMILGGALITGQQWAARMHTTQTYGEDSSALTRLEMWQWTFDFVKDHPLGGGFDVYKTSRIETPIGDTGEVMIQHGRAYHNSFFEMLGEQGWPGLFLFLGLCLRTLMAMQAVRRRTRGSEEFAWARDLASAVQIALLSVMTGGCFVGIAFQPMFWYVFALGESVRQHVRRAELGGVPAPLLTARSMPGLGVAGNTEPASLA